MSRRDLRFIHAGGKASYDTWPHTRKALVARRDIAVTEEELDQVAEIADQFDAEDRAFIAAGRHIQRIKQDTQQ